MSAHLETAGPFNMDGRDRRCDGDGCGARASFFLSYRRHPGTGLPMIEQRWCGQCVPAGWLPGQPLKVEAA